MLLMLDRGMMPLAGAGTLPSLTPAASLDPGWASANRPKLENQAEGLGAGAGCALECGVFFPGC